MAKSLVTVQNTQEAAQSQGTGSNYSPNRDNEDWKNCKDENGETWHQRRERWLSAHLKAQKEQRIETIDWVGVFGTIGELLWVLARNLVLIVTLPLWFPFYLAYAVLRHEKKARDSFGFTLLLLVGAVTFSALQGRIGRFWIAVALAVYCSWGYLAKRWDDSDE